MWRDGTTEVIKHKLVASLKLDDKMKKDANYEEREQVAQKGKRESNESGDCLSTRYIAA